MVGREAELAYLYQRFTQALDGERQVIFVSGEPGIGKTTLVDAFLEQISDRPHVHITSGQCVEQYGPGEAYLPLLEATARLCRAPGGEQRIEALQRYAPSWLAQLPGLLAPQAHDLLQQRAQGTSRERMVREIAEAAEMFTTQRGLVVVLEDLHWSDGSTLDWITYMALRRAPAKLLILGTYRPTETSINHQRLRGTVQDLLARRSCEELRVTPLREAAIRDYLCGRFGESRLPEALPTTLARRSGGNPLFVANIVDSFVRQEAVMEVDGQWIVRAEEVTELAERVPDTVRQLIERQVERLSEAEQRLLEAASVAGVEFAGAEVAAGLPTTVEEVETHCERFARAGQWLRVTGFAEWPDGTLSGRYGFRHALYHEVIQARVAEVRRMQLHRRIAARKEAAYGQRVGEIAAELAVHFEKGRDLQRTVHYLEKAGETAVHRSAHQEAIVYLRKGLDLLVTQAETPERTHQELALLVALGSSLIVTKGYAAPEVEQVYGYAQDLCCRVEGTPQLVPSLLGLCGFYCTRADLKTGHAHAQQLLALAQDSGDPELLLSAHTVTAMTLHWQGEAPQALRHLEQA
ncbi:MAG: ATP-binding protein, partial [Candidatus Binatia bacterium]